MRFLDPHTVRHGHAGVMKYMLAGVAVLCNGADISQWHCEIPFVYGQKMEHAVKESCYEPAIILPDIRETYQTLLHSFLELEAGWDGYDSIPLEDAAYDNAVSLISRLPHEILEKWEMFPSDNGTVLMVLKKHVLATVNIGKTTVSYIAKAEDGSDIRRGRGAFDVETVVKVMSEIVAAFQ